MCATYLDAGCFWLSSAHPLIARDRIGDIEFFGCKGLDVAKIRSAMPVHEGDEYSDRTKNEVRQAVAAMIGKEPTDVAAICCDEKEEPPSFYWPPRCIEQELCLRGRT